MEAFFQCDSVGGADGVWVVKMHCTTYGPIELTELTLLFKTEDLAKQYIVGREYQVLIQQPIPA